jgi:ATP-dependent Clp protease ATP-binding subunit ClpC
LTERIRRRPYSVVLLDEIEKAHPDVFNLLLQVLEDGRLTDSFGRKVDFRNTVLIMTSNLGAELLKKQGSLGFAPAKTEVTFEKMREQLMDEVKRTFKPEFLNRIDEVIVFQPLTKEDLVKIVELEISFVKERLREQQVLVELDQSAKDFIVEKGFDQMYGARPLKRVIQRYLEDPLAEEVIARRFKPGTPIRAFRKDDRLEFEGELISVAS